MELKILTSIPHKETDILTLTPIEVQFGELIVQFDLLTFKQYDKFERGITMFQQKTIVPSELTEEEQRFLEYDRMYLLIEPGLGLPYFLAQFARFMNRERAIEILRVWDAEHPKQTIGEFESEANLRWVFADYLYNNCNITDLMDILQQLRYLQGNIKKKLGEIYQTNPAETADTKQQPPQSSVSQLRLVSQQRKRLRKSRTSSS